MESVSNDKHEDQSIAQEWCRSKGDGWNVIRQLGLGGTAPVFEVASPDGLRALKIYDLQFSTGGSGEIEFKRVQQQLNLRGHDCSSLVQVYEGGRFNERLFLLMERAPGRELEKCLVEVPREKIRQIVDQVARAAIFLRSKNLCHRDIKSANIFVSDDFDHSTLLDISVVRDIYDPLGMGTDHDGQLPVVATARYSPPEYLFRLVEPGPQLWHALNVYQLGALLHDLIMKEPLFESDYKASAGNRYRFAWIVATVMPRIQANVDQDLVFLAGRALDKDWQRRSQLTLEDFLADAGTLRSHALQFLGLSDEASSDERGGLLASSIARTREVAQSLQEAVSERLRNDGVLALHSVRPGGDNNSKLLTFEWEAATSGVAASWGAVELRVTLSLVDRFGRRSFKSSAQLLAMIDGEQREAAIDFPDVEDNPQGEVSLLNQLYSGLADLSLKLGEARSETKEG